MGFLNRGLLNYNDVKSTIPKYKVFTALLSQSGGDDLQSQDSGSLTIGRTYLINSTPSLYGSDFTNVGAPNNNQGTYFVATGTTPNWGINPDPNMLDYNTGAPVAIVLENTIGNIWFSYVSPGVYHVNSDGLFTTEPIPVIMPSMMNPGDDTIFIGNRVTWQNNALITLETYNVEAGNISRNNGNLQNNFFEIRVFN
jgi:hypothetical protein